MAPAKPQLLYMERGTPGKWQLLLLDREEIKQINLHKKVDKWIIIHYNIKVRVDMGPCFEEILP